MNDRQYHHWRYKATAHIIEIELSKSNNEDKHSSLDTANRLQDAVYYSLSRDFISSNYNNSNSIEYFN